MSEMDDFYLANVTTPFMGKSQADLVPQSELGAHSDAPSNPPPKWSRTKKERRKSLKVLPPSTSIENLGIPEWAGEELAQFLLKVQHAKRRKSADPEYDEYFLNNYGRDDYADYYSDEEENLYDEEDMEGTPDASRPTFRDREDYWRLYEAKCNDGESTVTENGFLRFEAAVKKRSLKIEKFDMDGCGVGPSTGKALYEILKDDHRVRTLTLAKNALSDKGMKWLAQLISQNHSITSLDVSGNFLNPEGILSLAEGINASMIKHLNISSYHVEKNVLGSQGAQGLALIIQKEDCMLETLRMSSVEPGSFNPIFRALGLNQSIKTLDVSLNKLSDSELCNLFKAVEKSNVEVLDISGSRLDESSSTQLGTLLGSSKSLKQLNLSKCIANSIGSYSDTNISVALCSALSKGLSDPNCILETLNLSDNDLRDEGLEHLSPGLGNNSSLKDLNLSNCSLSHVGAKPFAKALSLNSSVITLNLRKNHLEDEGMQVLFEALDHSEESNSGIQYLNLNNNFFGDVGGIAMANALRNNDSLLEISFDQNLVKDDAAMEILRSIMGSGTQCNSTLQNLSYKLNGISHGITVRIESALKNNRSETYKTEVLNKKKLLNTLRRDEEKLKEVLRELEETEVVLREVMKEGEIVEEGLERWKDGEVSISDQMARDLHKITTEGGQLMEEINAEKRKIDTELKDKRFTFMETSAQLQFKISNEKRKQYMRKDQILKLQKELGLKQGEESRTLAFVQSLELQLKEELLTRKSTKSFVQSCNQKFIELRAKAKEEYMEGMIKYLEEERKKVRMKNKIDALTKGNTPKKSQTKASDIQPQNMDIPAFMVWFFGQKGVAALQEEDDKKAAAAAGAEDQVVAPVRKYIGVNEELNLRIGVSVDPNKDMKGKRIIEKSHTIQSLSMHGLHDETTIYVILQDAMLTQKFANSHFIFLQKKNEQKSVDQMVNRGAADKQVPRSGQGSRASDREDGEEPLPHEFTLTVSGGATIPLILRQIADKYMIESRQIRALVYDPNEPIKVEKPPTPVEEEKEEEEEEEKEEKINIGLMRQTSDTFAGFQQDASCALSDFSAKWKEFEKKLASGGHVNLEEQFAVSDDDEDEKVSGGNGSANNQGNKRGSGRRDSTDSVSKGKGKKSKTRRRVSSGSRRRSSDGLKRVSSANVDSGRGSGEYMKDIAYKRRSSSARQRQMERAKSVPSDPNMFTPYASPQEVRSQKPYLNRRRTMMTSAQMKPEMTEREIQALKRHSWNNPHARIGSADLGGGSAGNGPHRTYTLGPNGRRIEILSEPQASEHPPSASFSSYAPAFDGAASHGRSAQANPNFEVYGDNSGYYRHSVGGGGLNNSLNQNNSLNPNNLSPRARRRSLTSRVKKLQDSILPAVVLKPQVFNFSHPKERPKYSDSDQSFHRNAGSFVTKPSTVHSVEKVIGQYTTNKRRSMPAHMMRHALNSTNGNNNSGQYEQNHGKNGSQGREQDNHRPSGISVAPPRDTSPRNLSPRNLSPRTLTPLQDAPHLPPRVSVEPEHDEYGVDTTPAAISTENLSPTSLRTVVHMPSRSRPNRVSPRRGMQESESPDYSSQAQAVDTNKLSPTSFSGLRRRTSPMSFNRDMADMVEAHRRKKEKEETQNIFQNMEYTELAQADMHAQAEVNTRRNSGGLVDPIYGSEYENGSNSHKDHNDNDDSSHNNGTHTVMHRVPSVPVVTFSARSREDSVSSPNRRRSSVRFSIPGESELLIPGE